MKNHCQNIHDISQSRQSQRNDTDPDWRARLPAQYVDAVVPPQHFKRFREYEINAVRCVGYDADDQPCHIAHQVELTRPVSDDDEEFYEIVSYQEEMAAWRLRDDRWLVYRSTATDQCASPRSFYTLSPDMPR
ncbi:MAG: hypothetical protein H6R14_3057 [Proteobacteria bacterium]|nr:hypothetical protein [Pseudomonadota bacterium]